MPGDLRVLTLNHWGMGGNWAERRRVLVDGIRSLRPDVVAFQETVKNEDRDTAVELVGPEYEVLHQATGLLPDDPNSAAIASRWPVERVEEVDLHLTPRTSRFPATTLIAEIRAPDPVGPVLFVNHLPSWEPQLELERELQTVAAVRRIEELIAERRRHVVLAGDLDAVPEAASIRFLRGLQSLGGVSVWFQDAWQSAHAGEDVETFSTRNPLVTEDSDVRQERSRRIDYIFVRCDERGPTLEIDACELAFAEPVDGVWASDHFGLVADLRAP